MRVVGSMILLVAALNGEAVAQTRFATIVGEITDPSGAAVEGAQVTVRHAGTALERSDTSDGDGRYAIENLPSGTYEIVASGSGMRPAVVASQALSVGTTTHVPLELSLAGIEESVVVIAAAAPLIEATSEMGQVIRRSEVDGLPVVDRSFTALALLAPTVQADVRASGFSIAGQRGFNNNILVDGVTNRSSGRGDQLIAFSQDWIDEFRVSAAGYAAEFGSASGGVINVVTRSGTNDFHGRGFVFVRDGRLDGAPPWPRRSRASPSSGRGDI